MGTLKKIRHRDAFRIGICFDYDGQLKQSTQRIGTRWSQTLRWWWVDSKSESFKKIKPNSPKLKSSSPKLKTTFPKPEIAKYPNQAISHPVSGLQNSHDTIFIVDDKINNALLSHLGEEHQLEKPEPAGHALHRPTKQGRIPTCLSHRQKSLTSRRNSFFNSSNI